MKYRPEVDGLRSVAVVPVILFHAGYGLFSGGYVGVDVFFVISGYLITTIILDDLDRGRFSILNFYERRARRILPALFLVVAVSSVVAAAVLAPPDLVYYARSVLSVLAFVSNIHFWRESGYFDSAVELKPLLHTWSLAVEEQFYLFFPLMAMALWRFGWKPFLGAVLALSAVSFAVAYWGGYNSPSAAFYLLPTRIWELAAGAVAAILIPRMGPLPGGRAVCEALAWTGIALIAYACVAFSAATRFPGVATLAPVLGATLIVFCARPGTLAQRVLAWRPLVFVGLLSYSAYLWHQPLFAFARYLSIGAEPGPWLMGALSLAVLPLAWASWRFVETPFRRREAVPLRPLVASLSAGAAALAAMALAAVLTAGFPGRDVGLVAGNFESDNKALRSATWDPLRQLSGDRGYTVDRNGFDRTAWFDPADPRTPMLLVGNSHSKDLYNVLIHAESATARYQLARYGVELRQAAAGGLFEAPNYRDAEVVMLVTRHTGADVAALPELIARIRADGKRPVLVKGVFEWETVYDRTLGDVMLMRAAAERDLDAPGADAELARAINARHWADYAAGHTGRAQVAGFNAEILRLGAELGVPVLDRMDYVCEPAREICHVMGPAYTKYLPDASHHTLAGAAFYAGRVDALGWLDPVTRPPEG